MKTSSYEATQVNLRIVRVCPGYKYTTMDTVVLIPLTVGYVSAH